MASPSPVATGRYIAAQPYLPDVAVATVGHHPTDAGAMDAGSSLPCTVAMWARQFPPSPRLTEGPTC
ncbi:hypothetical protein E2562_019040 [Oryza meyeriana var. granulata]|uniref:Uncharacterized protein n=1 Tax=Oryza meyeriana var. granulata TaxID=110450 RepID=A0A6G1EMX2_9ORYZ|nr:hypothetical protein E2562_019040 [Oryza meyeriana var. granulata]